MDMYGRFANIYDELMMDFNYEDWFKYIKQIFLEHGKNPKTILEMACGTGNMSYHLAKSGYDLTCFDLSSDMLSCAYEKLRKYKNVDIMNQNMIDFKVNKRFQGVLSICDSINYITKKEDLKRVFQNVWHHLEEDGIFIFDINSYYKLKHVIGNNIFIEDREDVFYTWQNYYDETNDICEFYLTFFVSEDGIKYERFDEEHIEKAYSPEEIIALLNNVGFKNIDVYSGFTFEKVHEKTERINFVAIK